MTKKKESRQSEAIRNNVQVSFAIIGEGAGAAEDKSADAAHVSATEIARMLGGKVTPNRCCVISLTTDDDSFCPWEIQMDSQQFKARVCVSDSSYSFEAKHRNGEKALLEEAIFCVSFKNVDRTMFIKDRVDTVSKALGVDVFRQGFADDKLVERYLLSKPVQGCIEQIDFKPLSRLFLSPIQLNATSKMKSPAACVSQIRAFMDLIQALACARKPEKGRKRNGGASV